MAGIGRKIKAESGGKPKVKTVANESAGVVPNAPPYPEEKLFPESEWKQQAQIEADIALAKLFPRNTEK